MNNFSRGVWAFSLFILGSVFSFSYALNGAYAWKLCYTLSLVSSILYLYKFRKNFFSASSFFAILSLVAITFPAVPYLFFEIESRDFFFESIFINSLGIFFFLGTCFLKSPAQAPIAENKIFLKSLDWEKFYIVNMKMFFASLPFVFLAINAAGAWGAFFDFEDSGYDRIASMKGLGPLMIFSIINVTSAYYWGVGFWIKKKYLKSISIILFSLFLNGFTQGRGNLLYVFFASLLFYLALHGFNWKILGISFFGGIIILLTKITRGWGTSSDLPWQIQFFMQFVGDFDSLNNCAPLIDYTNKNGFFGFYHIWSNLLVYIPRDLFPFKPHDIGALYLNTYIFPGVYLGAEGGTGLAFGFQGTWYAAAGLITLFIGNILLGWCLATLDQKFKNDLKRGTPSVMLLSYIMIIGQSVITYRDGFYTFMNVAFYMGAYFLFYKLFGSLKGKHETLMPSRNLDAS